jgi:hypothetical protein
MRPSRFLLTSILFDMMLTSDAAAAANRASHQMNLHGANQFAARCVSVKIPGSYSLNISSKHE